MHSVFIAPHNDDESLFGAFTIQRERPLVVIVTDSFMQAARGDLVDGQPVTADLRRDETLKACAVLGAPVSFLGVHDDLPADDFYLAVYRKLHDLLDFAELVYAPALEHGNKQHDAVHLAVNAMFMGVERRWYATYSNRNKSFSNRGAVQVDGDQVEREKKQRALDCYRSQLPRSRHHFEAVKDQPEWWS